MIGHQPVNKEGWNLSVGPEGQRRVVLRAVTGDTKHTLKRFAQAQNLNEVPPITPSNKSI